VIERLHLVKSDSFMSSICARAVSDQPYEQQYLMQYSILALSTKECGHDQWP
jgi:hypothetical protein